VSLSPDRPAAEPALGILLLPDRYRTDPAARRAPLRGLLHRRAPVHRHPPPSRDHGDRRLRALLLARAFARHPRARGDRRGLGALLAPRGRRRGLAAGP